jgi:asparagine N-glycosylation enzyme membrane subunit Stt3
LIGERIGGVAAGVWAGLLCALFPCPYLWFGYVDHHVFEPIWLGVYLLAYIRALGNLEGRPERALLLGVAAGVAVTAGLVTTTILPLLVPLHIGLSIGQFTRVWRDAERRRRLATLDTLIWAASLTALAPFVATRIAEPGGINPALTTCWHMMLVACSASLALAWWKGRPASAHRRLLLALAAALAIIMLIAIAGTDLRVSIAFVKYGIEHIFTKDPWMASIRESQRLFDSDFGFIIATYTLLVVAWPVVLAWLLWEGWRRSALLWALALMGLFASCLAILQIKFGLFLLVPYTAGLGYALNRLFVVALRRTAEESPSLAGRVRRAGSLVIAASFLVALLPTLTAIHFRTQSLFDGANASLLDAFRWIRARTPRSSATGEATADYGIAADWSYGHWIVHFADRPVVASPLGLPGPLREGIRDGARAFMLPPSEAREILTRRRIRYLLTPVSIGFNLHLAYWDESTGGLPEGFDQTRTFRASLLHHLLQGGVPLGSSERDVLRHFRLVYESWPERERNPNSHPSVALFEYVPGVEIVGRSRPDTTVTIRAPVKTAEGRVFVYADAVRADTAGVFRALLPYAGGAQTHAEVGLEAPYTITADVATSSLWPSERDVLSGTRYEINLLDTPEKPGRAGGKSPARR